VGGDDTCVFTDQILAAPFHPELKRPVAEGKCIGTFVEKGDPSADNVSDFPGLADLIEAALDDGRVERRARVCYFLLENGLV